MSMTKTLGVRVPIDLLQRVDEYRKPIEMTRSAAIVALVGKALGEQRPRKHRTTIGNSQNHETGAAAQAWGVITNRKIARALGATPAEDRPTETASEFMLDRQRVTIRSARVTNNMCGLTNRMRDRVDMIICASQTVGGHFELYGLTPEQWRENARELAPTNRNYRRLTMLSRSTYRRIGQDLGEVEIED